MRTALLGTNYPGRQAVNHCPLAKPRGAFHKLGGPVPFPPGRPVGLVQIPSAVGLAPIPFDEPMVLANSANSRTFQKLTFEGALEL